MDTTTKQKKTRSRNLTAYELETIPPATNWKLEMAKEHMHAELLRLKAGQEGCGCRDCQEFYKIIDLSPFGSRVMRFDNAIIVGAGSTGADLLKSESSGWIADDQVFVFAGKCYGLLENGQTICLGKENDVKETLATKKIPDSIRGLSRVVLEKIIIKKMEESNGESTVNPVPTVPTTLRAPSVKQRNNQRVRPIVTSRRVPLNARLPAIEQQFALHFPEQE